MYLIVDSPNFPLRPAQSTKTLLTNSLIFVVVGVFLAIVGVVLAALLDKAVRFPEDVVIGLELPVFAILPAWPAPKKAGKTPKQAGANPVSTDKRK